MKSKHRAMMQKMVVCVLAAVSLTAFAAEADPLGYALLIQQSPADGGTVSPGAGVHKIGIGRSVQLVATPQPGYRFMYWLGDVSGTASPETSINLDSPKMVVAVFEREDFDDELFAAGPVSGRGGMGGLRGTPNPMTGAGGVSPANGRRQSFSIPTFSDPADFFNDDFPVPGEGNFPVPGDTTADDNVIPEPATLSLLGLGMVTLLRKRK